MNEVQIVVPGVSKVLDAKIRARAKRNQRSRAAEMRVLLEEAVRQAEADERTAQQQAA